ncbi:MAG: hypothetical protein IJR99_15190 [Kiritimatiellae bacterium]|nr:hypothetical protein [Kiritimatiellia bacterium]
MKHHFKKTVLLASVCVFGHGANPALCATNDTAACVTVQEEREIKEAIAKAPEMVLSQTNSVREYTAAIWEKIKKCPAPETRYRYLRRLMESACRVDFAEVEDLIPKDKDYKKIRLGLGFYTCREEEVVYLLVNAYDRLMDFAEGIWEKIAFAHASVPCVEQFEPFFMLIAKLKSEKKRLGTSPLVTKYMSVYLEVDSDYVEFVANRIERRFHFTYLQNLCESPDLQDIARFKERFRQVVGRPIRTEEEYRADSRRKVEDFIRKREEGK